MDVIKTCRLGVYLWELVNKSTISACSRKEISLKQEVAILLYDSSERYVSRMNSTIPLNVAFYTFRLYLCGNCVHYKIKLTR